MVPATIFVVDDNTENLTVLGELLSPEFRVLAASSGQRALDLIRGGARPDVMLLDIMMPGMSGFEVLERLRADPEAPFMPVIFVTALGAAADEERGFVSGAADYITKPFRPAVVLARVRAHVEIKRARDRLADQNIHLDAEVGRRMAETQHIQDVSIHALARLAEIRDNETGNHLRRTQEYVRTLAEALKGHPRFAPVLDAATITLIAKSAPLHDIGKVGIPDSILQKPGKLTPAEWEIMRTHSALGAEAIEHAERDSDRPVAFLRHAKEIARSHHEKWNGKGYPAGLAGDAIPVSARIMALADVFDALISRRVYKEPMSYVAAREIIIKDRGVHFDPDIVDAFIDRFDAFQAIAEKYADSEAMVNAKAASLRGVA
jgi:putative two-component system response regulator